MGKAYDEVFKKIQVTEADLERAEERGELGETKIMELEEELKVVATNLKSLEVAEEKANQRETSNKDQIKTLTAKLKQAEARAEFAEKSVAKLQKEVDRLEDELMGEQEKLKGITEELEQTFAEMSGYLFQFSPRCPDICSNLNRSWPKCLDVTSTLDLLIR